MDILQDIHSQFYKIIKQNKNKYEIISCKIHLKDLSDHRIKHEKALVQEKQRKDEIAKLEKEKQELERKIRSLR